MKEPERHSVEGIKRVWQLQAVRALPQDRFRIGLAYLGLLGVSEGTVFAFFLGQNKYAKTVVAEKLQQFEWNLVMLRQFWEAAKVVFPQDITDRDVAFLAEQCEPDAVDSYLRHLAAPPSIEDGDLIRLILSAAEPTIEG